MLTQDDVSLLLVGSKNFFKMTAIMREKIKDVQMSPEDTLPTFLL